MTNIQYNMRDIFLLFAMIFPINNCVLGILLGDQTFWLKKTETFLQLRLPEIFFPFWLVAKIPASHDCEGRCNGLFDWRSLHF